MAAATGIAGGGSAQGGKGTKAAEEEARRKAEEARRQAEEARRQAELAARAADTFASSHSGNAALGNQLQPPTGETQVQLEAERAYAQLAGTAEGRAALSTLGIDDGPELRRFADQVASGDSGALAQFFAATGGEGPLAERFSKALGTVNADAEVALADAEPRDEHGVTASEREDLLAAGFSDDQINEMGEALPHLVAAIRADTPEEALAHVAAALEAAPSFTDAAWEVFSSRPEIRAFFQDELGIDLSLLPNPSEAIPRVLALVEAVRSEDPAAITSALVELASVADAAAFEGLLAKVGALLPDEVQDFLAGLAGNEDLNAVLSALAADPNLPSLVQAIVDGDVEELLVTLAANPALLEAVGQAVADIPAVRALFEQLGIDPAQVENLEGLLAALAGDPNLPQIVEALADGEVEDAVALLAQNPEVLTALGELLAELPVVQAAAEALGIDLSELPDLGAALPDLLALANAIEAGDASAIAEGLIKVGELLGTEAFSGMWAKIADKLPPSVAAFFGDLVGNPDLQGALTALASDPNLPALLQAIEDGDLGEVARLLGQNEAFMESAGHLLASIGPVRQFLTETLGLTDAEISALAGTVPDVIAALSAESPEEALQHLLQAAAEITDSGLAQKVISAVTGSDVWQKLPQEVRTFVEGLLADPELQAFAQALVAAPDFSGILSNLVSGEVGAALQQILANPALLTAGGAALLDIPVVRDFVADVLGIPPERVKELAPSLPALMAALQSDSPEEAINLLLEAGAALPADLVNTILGNVGARVADALGLDAQTRDFLQSVLTDPALPALLKTSGDTLKTALEALLSGDVDEAIAVLLGDTALASFVGEKLLEIPAVRARVAELFGLTEDELDALGGAATSLLRAFAAATAEPPNGQEVARHLVAALGEVPLELAQSLLETFADALKLPDSLKDTLARALPRLHGLLSDPAAQQMLAQLLSGDPGAAMQTLLDHPELGVELVRVVGEALELEPAVIAAIEAALPLIGDEAFRGPLGDLLKAILKGDSGAALDALGALGGAVQSLAESKDPRLTQLFNALGLLPGGIGELFSSPELNEYIVQSGTAEELISAAVKLANGDLQGAAEDLFEAAKDLLGAGDGPSIELPGGFKVTEEGARMLAQLFQNLFNALPNGVKNEIKAVIQRALGSTIPIFGSLITGVIDAKEFWDALQDGDTLDQFIAGTQLLLDGAGMFAQGLVTPLKVVLAALQAYRAIDNMSDLVDDVAGIFFGISNDPDEEVLSNEEALALSYFGGDVEVMQAALAQPPLNELASDPAALAAFLETAMAMGIEPEELPAFAAQVLEGYRRETGDDGSLLHLAQELILTVNGMGQGGRAGQHTNDARIRTFLRQFISDEALAAVGGEPLRTWSDLHDEDSWGIPDALDQLQALYPELDGLPKSTVDGLVAAAQALGIPPSEFFAWVESLRNQVGPDGLEQLLSQISYIVSEADRFSEDGVYDIEGAIVALFESQYPGLYEPFVAPAPEAEAA